MKNILHDNKRMKSLSPTLPTFGNATERSGR